MRIACHCRRIDWNTREFFSMMLFPFGTEFHLGIRVWKQFHNEQRAQCWCSHALTHEQNENCERFVLFIHHGKGRGDCKIPTCHYTNTKLRLKCLCLIKRIQNTAFCQKKGIQPEKCHKWWWRRIQNTGWPIVWEMEVLPRINGGRNILQSIKRIGLVTFCVETAFSNMLLKKR